MDCNGVIFLGENILSLNTNVKACHATILLPGNFMLVFKNGNTPEQKPHRYNLNHFYSSFMLIRVSKGVKKRFHASFHTGSPDALSERVSAFRVSIQTVHEVRHGKIKVLRRDSVLGVDDTLHELHSLSLVDSQHHVVVQELALLHQDLGVVRYHITINHRRESRVIFGGRDVLLHQFTVAPTLEASDQLAAVVDAAAHPLPQLLGIFAGLVVNGPTGQGTAALDDGSVEEV